jgi:hypothetical protein
MGISEVLVIVVGFVISSIFFFGSFGFVDQDGAFTIGGFALFIGGIAGYCMTVYAVVKSL